MLDFYKISQKTVGHGGTRRIEVSPSFLYGYSKDLMIRGGTFYAVWDEENHRWTKDITRLTQMVDETLYIRRDKLLEKEEIPIQVSDMRTHTTGHMRRFLQYCKDSPDNFTSLDPKIVFSNTETTRESYSTQSLSYPIEPGSTEAFDELFGVLYGEDELRKLKWALGSIITGDSGSIIQKFYVLFGKPGTGKSTVLTLISKMFEGYVTSFSAEAMVNSAFPLESLRSNSPIAVDHEGNLSRINSNGPLSAVVSHDNMSVNVKFQSPYNERFRTTLFIATNKPVQITDAKSGLTRRMIDIRPTGIIVEERKYHILVNQMTYEYGAIAQSCLDVYKQLGPFYYSDYTPIMMLEYTNHLYNFIRAFSDDFSLRSHIPLSDIWSMYKAWCEESNIHYPMSAHIMREQLKDYWESYDERLRMEDGTRPRHVYSGFKKNAFERQYKAAMGIKDQEEDWLDLGRHISVFDTVCANQPALYALPSGALESKWQYATTTLQDKDTSRLHHVLPQKDMVMVDFDIKSETGEKSLDLNIQAARNFPPTYAETSKSGKGLHLYYYYKGDIDKLARAFPDNPDIEIIVPKGYRSFRRKLDLCNTHEITTISSGLPIADNKVRGGRMKQTDFALGNEHTLRNRVVRTMNKEFLPATKPSIDFIFYLLDKAYSEGFEYDLTDLKDSVRSFAANSTNQSAYCLDVVKKMRFKSFHIREEIPEVNDDRLVFYDVEVFKNLFLVMWKFKGSDQVIRMTNPTPSEIANFVTTYRIVGFNNRFYDNHILYARMLGESLDQLFARSQAIIEGHKEGMLSQAYGLSYADVKGFIAVENWRSLKSWEIELGIQHDELELDWNAPVPEEMWDRVAEYCENDVRATEAVFDYHIADFRAREIIAALSGLRVNDGTSKHVQKIIFGDNEHPQLEFNIPDLSIEFPGYTFDKFAPKGKKSLYRGEYVGEGGYVYAEHGMYNNVAYLDIASMHPTSLVEMNFFGPYTKKYKDMLDARVLIKHGQLEEVGKMFDGRLSDILDKASSPKDLSNALKIVLNSVYGYTGSNKYDRPFWDPRNEQNVIAKRGALFMVDLRNALLERGCVPFHFKTDSVKIADHTEEDIRFVREFGSKYGYTFELEGVYEKLALVTDADLAGKWADTGEWDVVGARFKKPPYVYKKLFSGEQITIDDMVIMNTTKGSSAIYLEAENGGLDFMGKVGLFLPMKTHGGSLYRIDGERKSAINGSKGYRWLPADVVLNLHLEDDIDESYYEKLVQEAYDKLASVGDAYAFLGD